MLGPLLEVEEGVELLRMCFNSVLCLPPTEFLQKDASSPTEAQANVVSISLMFVSLALVFYFFNFILLIVLLYLSRFYPFVPYTQHHPLPQALFMSMGHAYKFFGYSISYTALYIPKAIL